MKYSHRDMALAAINALNGIYTMRVSYPYKVCVLFFLAIFITEAYYLMNFFNI